MSEQVSLCEKRIKELGEVITDGKKSQVSRSYSEILKVSSVQNPNSVQPQSAGVIDEKGDDVVNRNSNNTDNDQEWRLVERLQQRNIKAVVGSNKEVSSLVGVERRRRDTWDIYVGNLKEDVTELRIVEYLKDKGVEGKMCFLLPSRIQGTRSARVRVPLEFKNIVLESNF